MARVTNAEAGVEVMTVGENRRISVDMDGALFDYFQMIMDKKSWQIVG